MRQHNQAFIDTYDAFTEKKTRDLELQFIQELFHARFMTPISHDGVMDDPTKLTAENVTFLLIANTEQEQYLLAFTDEEELHKWSDKPQQTLTMNCDGFSQLLAQNSAEIKGFVINAFHQNIIIKPELLKYFHHRMEEVLLKQGTKVQVRQPQPYPQELTKALSDFFATQPLVQKAYLFAAKQDDEEENLLLILGFMGDQTQLFASVATLANDFLAKGSHIDILPFKNDFAQKICAEEKPFYYK